MAAQIGSIYVGLTADLQRFVGDFQRGERTVTAFSRNTSRHLATVTAHNAAMTKSIATLVPAYRSLGNAQAFMVRGLGVAGLGISAAGTVSAITSAAGQYVTLQNQLKVTGLQGRELQSTISGLTDIAQRHGAAIAPLAVLYSRASQVQKELGASSADLMKFTDGVALALRVSSSDAEQASGALLQLSQALGSGTVRAEEFNSVNEGARPILQAVAAGLLEAGNSVSKLRQLVLEGKVSSEAFFRAFLAGMPQLSAQAAMTEATVGQATNRISNSFIGLVGKIDETVGASKSFAQNLNNVASVIDRVPGVIDALNSRLKGTEKYFDRLAIHPFFGLLGRLANVKFSAEEALRAGALNVPGADSEEVRKLVSLTKEIADWEKQLADARATASATGLDVDRQRLSMIEATVKALREEEQAISATTRAAVNSFLSGSQASARRIPEFALSQEGRAPYVPSVKPVSLADFKPPAAKQDNAATLNEYERATRSISTRSAEIERQTRTIGASTFEQARSRAELQLLTAAERAGAQVTAQRREEIARLSNEYATHVVGLEKAENSLERLYERQRFFAETAFDAFDRLALSGEKFDDVLKDITKNLMKAVVQAALLGTGPFGRGNVGPSGVGGLFGAIGGMFTGGKYDSGGIAGMVGFGPRTKIGPIPIADSGLGPRNFLSILEEGEAVLTRQLTGRTMRVMDGLSRIGGGGSGMEIHVHEAPGGDKADVRRSPDGSRIDVIMRRQVDDTSAGLVDSGESRLNKSLERRYGLQPKL